MQNESLTPPSLDGTLALEPNVIRIAPNDSLEETHHISANFTAQTNGVFVQNPFNIGQQFSVSVLGPGAQGGGPNGTFNAVGLFSAQGGANYYRGNGGWQNPINMLSFSGDYYEGMLWDHGPLSGADWTNIILGQSQFNDPNYNFNLFDIQNSDNSNCLVNYAPPLNTFTFGSHCNEVFQVQSSLPAAIINVQSSSSGLVSAQGYNFAPYSNGLDQTTWHLTGGGSGTTTCAITDDQGNPACTMTGTTGYNWDDSNTASYTAMTLNATYATQARIAVAVVGDQFTISGNAQGSPHIVPADTGWHNYCQTYVANNNSALQNFADINLVPTSGSETIYVSNVVTSPGSCPIFPLTTTNNQFTTLTNINHVVQM